MESNLPVPTPSDTATLNPRPRVHPGVVAATLLIVLFSGIGIAYLLHNRSASNSPDAATMGVGLNTSGGSSSGGSAAGGMAPQSAPDATARQGTLLSDGSVVAPIQESPSVASASDPAPGTLLSDGSVVAPIEETSPVAPVETGPPAAACAECATVVALHEIKVQGEGTGLGAVGGGVAGGLIGNTVGSGRGRDLMTVLGAVGGALAGNAVEKNARSKIDYELVVRFENGRTRHFKRLQPWPYGVGEPVKVVKGEVLPRRG